MATKNAQKPDVVKLPKWTITRDRDTLIFHAVRRKEVLTKQYGSEHAAKCALGRVRYNSTVAEDIIRNIRIAQLRPGGERPSRGGRGRLKADMLLAVLIHETSDRLDIDPDDLLKETIEISIAKLKAKEKADLLPRVRLAMGEANKKLAKEEERRLEAKAKREAKKG